LTQIFDLDESITFNSREDGRSTGVVDEYLVLVIQDPFGGK